MMTYSQTGLHLTEQFESCRLIAYLDTSLVWTIGWGHTASVIPGQTCTPAQADAWLMEDIQWAASIVNRMVTVALSQLEFDALVDLVFNIGAGAFAKSTMLALVNKGDYTGAADEFDKWDHSGGKTVAGLLRRRQAETTEFQGV